MILALLPILAFGAPVEDSAESRMYGNGDYCAADKDMNLCCSEDENVKSLWDNANSANFYDGDCDLNTSGHDKSPNDFAAEKGLDTAELGVSVESGKCIFTCPYELNDDAKAAAAAVGAALFMVVILPIIIGVCICACIIYFCCCRKSKPQTVIVQQAAQ